MCTTSTLLHSAGVLIIWDRIFGTFKAEDKQIRSYGLAKPLETFNPIIANFEHFIRISYSPLLLFKRRVRHGNVFQIFHLNQFQPGRVGNPALGRNSMDSLDHEPGDISFQKICFFLICYRFFLNI